MSINPSNPTILKGLGTPALGLTQNINGSLEWFDKSTNRWRPAVRQHTIRDRLLQQTNALGAYRFPRGAGNGNNITAPLASDLNDGGDWQDRPDRLFQLDPTDDQYRKEPTAVLMDGDRVMLDPFDHPIRDFGDELPIVLSSEIKGWEVENYLRRNLAIKAYDLIARCPKVYTVGNMSHTDPPRIQSIRERATKFREQAGCLAWQDRDGGKDIREYMMSILPAGATTTRSLGADLTVAQKKARKAKNRGKHPNKRRISVREAEAKTGKGHGNVGHSPDDDSNEDTVAEEDGAEILGSKVKGHGRVPFKAESEDSDRSPSNDLDLSKSSRNDTEAMDHGLSKDGTIDPKKLSRGKMFSRDPARHDFLMMTPSREQITRSVMAQAEVTAISGTPGSKTDFSSLDEDEPILGTKDPRFGDVQANNESPGPSVQKRKRVALSLPTTPDNTEEPVVRRPKKAKRVPGSSKIAFEKPSKGVGLTKVSSDAGKGKERETPDLVQPEHEDNDEAASMTIVQPEHEVIDEGASTRIVPQPTDESTLVELEEEDVAGPNNEAIEDTDVRYWTPTTGRDVRKIRRALNFNIMDYARWTKQVFSKELFPVHRLSYMDQTMMLQRKFNEEWKAAQREEYPPRLFTLPKWVGSFGDWNVADGDERGRVLLKMLNKWANERERA